MLFLVGVSSSLVRGLVWVIFILSYFLFYTYFYTLHFLILHCQLQSGHGLQPLHPQAHKGLWFTRQRLCWRVSPLSSRMTPRAEAGTGRQQSPAVVRLSPCTAGSAHSRASLCWGQKSYLLGYNSYLWTRRHKLESSSTHLLTPWQSHLVCFSRDSIKKVKFGKVQ